MEITIPILQSIIYFLTKSLNLSTKFLSFLSVSSQNQIEKPSPKSHQTETIRTGEKICTKREDAELAMRKMGLIGEKEKLKKFMESEEFDSMFEEKEPSVEEIKDAFSVFDENNDGFVEAEDLQRVLCELGFVRESGLDFCKEMILINDKDGDGRIDFGEFVKLLESSFC